MDKERINAIIKQYEKCTRNNLFCLVIPLRRL